MQLKFRYNGWRSRGGKAIPTPRLLSVHEAGRTELLPVTNVRTETIQQRVCPVPAWVARSICFVQNGTNLKLQELSTILGYCSPTNDLLNDQSDLLLTDIWCTGLCRGPNLPFNNGFVQSNWHEPEVQVGHRFTSRRALLAGQSLRVLTTRSTMLQSLTTHIL